MPFLSLSEQLTRISQCLFRLGLNLGSGFWACWDRGLGTWTLKHGNTFLDTLYSQSLKYFILFVDHPFYPELDGDPDFILNAGSYW